jgi:hypothetical protein
VACRDIVEMENSAAQSNVTLGAAAPPNEERESLSPCL